MSGTRVQTDRPFTACLIAILAVAALTVVSIARQDGEPLKGLGFIPKLRALTVKVSVPPVGAKALGTTASEHTRIYRVDVWSAVQLAAARPAFLIIYIPGWGGTRADNTALLTALANAGYVVLAIDDIAHDTPYDDPLDEAARTAPYDLSTEVATRRFVDAAHRRAALQTAKASRLLDALASDPLVLSQVAPVGVRFDQVGVLGYSFGGATAAELGKRDPRVVAAANFDGWHFGPGADQKAAFPYLMINSIESRIDPAAERLPDSQPRNEALLNAAESARQALQAAARPDTYRVYLQGARHGDLSDAVGSWRRVLTRWKSGGALVAPAQARRALDTTIVSFFDTHLRQFPSASMESVLASHPELVPLGSQSFR